MSIDDLVMSQEQWALEMLGRAEVLIPCQHHEGVYVEGGSDLQEGFKYSMKVFKNNEDNCPFSSTREMTDSVQLTYYEHCGNDVCPLCFKHIDD